MGWGWAILGVVIGAIWGYVDYDERGGAGGPIVAGIFTIVGLLDSIFDIWGQLIGQCNTVPVGASQCVGNLYNISLGVLSGGAAFLLVWLVRWGVAESRGASVVQDTGFGTRSPGSATTGSPSTPRTGRPTHSNSGANARPDRARSTWDEIKAANRPVEADTAAKSVDGAATAQHASGAGLRWVACPNCSRTFAIGRAAIVRCPHCASQVKTV